MYSLPYIAHLWLKLLYFEQQWSDPGSPLQPVLFHPHSSGWRYYLLYCLSRLWKISLCMLQEWTWPKSLPKKCPFSLNETNVIFFTIWNLKCSFKTTKVYKVRRESQVAFNKKRHLKALLRTFLGRERARHPDTFLHLASDTYVSVWRTTMWPQFVVGKMRTLLLSRK